MHAHTNVFSSSPALSSNFLFHSIFCLHSLFPLALRSLILNILTGFSFHSLPIVFIHAAVQLIENQTNVETPEIHHAAHGAWIVQSFVYIFVFFFFAYLFACLIYCLSIRYISLSLILLYLVIKFNLSRIFTCCFFFHFCFSFFHHNHRRPFHLFSFSYLLLPS